MTTEESKQIEIIKLKGRGITITQNDNKVELSETLLDLIEACGDKFISLERKGIDMWHCRPCYGECTNYKTPTEAVANLWLEIKKTN